MTLRPAGLAAFEEDVLASLAAAFAGARLPGREGAADRQVVFRLAGLPMGLTKGQEQTGGAASAIRQVGDKLERALARHASGGFGHFGRVPVLVDVETEGKPLSDMDQMSDTPRLSQPMRVSDASVRPVRQPDILAQLVEELPDWMDDE